MKVELPCSCGKKDCPNKIRIDQNEHKIWIDHEVGGKDLLIYSSASRLRRFAKDILRIFPSDRPSNR